MATIPTLGAAGSGPGSMGWPLRPRLDWPHPRPDSGATSPEAEHSRSWLLDDNDLGVLLGHTELFKRRLHSFFDRLPNCLDPFHGLSASPWALVPGTRLGL